MVNWIRAVESKSLKVGKSLKIGKNRIKNRIKSENRRNRIWFTLWFHSSSLVRFPNPLASTVYWGTSPWSSSTSSPSSLSLWPVGRWSQIPLTRSIAHTVPILVQLDICCKNSFAEVCHILKTILFKKLHTTAGRKGKSSLCIIDPLWTKPVHSRESERDYWARGYLLISSKKVNADCNQLCF